MPWSRAEAIHQQTEGNPLFVQELLRYLVERRSRTCESAIATSCNRATQGAWREVPSDLGWDRPNMETQVVMAQIASKPTI